MATLLGPAEIRELAARLQIAPTKKLGQNFVHDANTVRRIVAAGDVSASSRVLEIGPGLGSLTLGLTETGASVTAVEIDARLAEALPATVTAMQPAARLRVLHLDALRLDEHALEEQPDRLVANLPYNISVPVLLHLLAELPSIDRALVMVQAEVGHRIAAGPGSKVYGAPSVKAAWYGGWRVTGQVSRQVFWPVPNVDSVLVGFRRHEPPGDETLRAQVFSLVDAGFQQRRKMLRQSLAASLGGSARAAEVITAAGIAPTARGEALSPDDFVRLGRTVLDLAV